MCVWICSMCVYMFVCMDAHMWRFEVDERCLRSLSMFYCFIYLSRQGNSLNLALTDWLNWLASQLEIPSCLYLLSPPTSAGVIDACHCTSFCKQVLGMEHPSSDWNIHLLSHLTGSMCTSEFLIAIPGIPRWKHPFLMGLSDISLLRMNAQIPTKADTLHDCFQWRRDSIRVRVGKENVKGIETVCSGGGCVNID